MRAVSRIIFLGTCLLPIASNGNADLPVSGVYSNMALSGEEDVSGIELFIVGATDGYHALVQCAKAEPMPPVLVTVTVNEPDISFTLPAVAKTGCPGTKATGRLSDNGLELKFGSHSKPVKLIRDKSFWTRQQDE